MTDRTFVPDGVGVARMLLDVAGPGRVGDVETTTWPNRGYLVPDDVAAEYQRRIAPPDPIVEKPAPPVVEEPAPRVDITAAIAAAGRKKPASRRKKTGPKE